jgi:aryl-alcohol dehydrogenase-like predicted oxidoreductase
MEYQNLGSTGLTVSRLIFGGAHIGEIVFEEKTQELVQAAWDIGVNTFYTADDYNNGTAERILGEAIRSRRDDLVLIVKTGYRVGTDLVPTSIGEHNATHGRGLLDHNKLWRKGIPPTSRGLNRKHLTSALEASLRRLQTEYIDVYSTHLWDIYTPIEETLETFEDFIRQGKVRYISCSQTAPWQLYRALWASDKLHTSRYESTQIRLNLLERGASADYLPAARAAGVSVLAFNSLAGELLTGDYSRDSPRPTGRGHRQYYMDMYWNSATFDFLDRFREVATKMGRSMSHLAQAWVLAQQPVLALLVGPNEPHDLASPSAAVAHPLDDGELAFLNEWLDGHRVDFRNA